MRKHPLLVLITPIIILTALGLFGQGAMGSHASRLAAVQTRSTSTTTPERSVSRVRLKVAVELYSTTPRPFVLENLRVSSALSHQHDLRPMRAVHVRGVAPALGVWRSLRICESGNNYRADTGNGYYGAYQFALRTWHALGYSNYPDDASITAQDAAARKLAEREGFSAWPTCAAVLRLD